MRRYDLCVFDLDGTLCDTREDIAWAANRMRADLGLAEPAIKRVLTDCYALLGLISFFTVGDDEVRAWSVPRGTRAQEAAGAIHSDIARGFIRAEVVGYEELVAAEGSMALVRERGQFKLEGKEYVVRDGEVCHVRFNVAK